MPTYQVNINGEISIKHAKNVGDLKGKIIRKLLNDIGHYDFKKISWKQIKDPKHYKQDRLIA